MHSASSGGRAEAEHSFFFADDWGKYASIYVEVEGKGGINDIVRTPHFDKVAKQGVLFRSAHVNAPSCTPCRSSLLSGQYFWRAGRGAILRGAVWDERIPSYSLLLRDVGYQIGKTYKVWGPAPSDAPYGGEKYAFQKAGGRINLFSQNVTKMVAEGIGQVLAALEVSGQIANTLVVLTSDQGYAWGHHGFRAKLAPYDANIRSPLIISMPGTLPEGKVCRTPVGGADLPPTFFSFAGLHLPWAMHGHDLTPLLKSPDANWPHTTMQPFTADKFDAACDVVPPPPDNHHKSGVSWYVMLSEGRHKYIRTLEAGEPEELYDLLADSEELTNLATEPEYATTVQKLRAAALAELRRTSAKMVESLPPVKE